MPICLSVFCLRLSRLQGFVIGGWFGLCFSGCCLWDKVLSTCSAFPTPILQTPYLNYRLKKLFRGLCIYTREILVQGDPFRAQVI